MRPFSLKKIRTALAILLVIVFFVPTQAYAAVAFGTIGAIAGGSTSLSVAHPTSIAVGDLLVLSVVNKYPTDGPSIPTGWQLASSSQGRGGIGSAGADSGEVYTTVFVRVADGTESGDLAVSVPSANCAAGTISRYTKSVGNGWDVMATYGNDNIAGHNNWSATAATNPDITSGDMIITTSGINGDSATYGSQSLSASGATIGSHTERADGGSSTANDCDIVVATHAVTAGTASAAPVFTMTSSTNDANGPTGATVFLRIREATVSGTGVTITDSTTITASTSVLGTLAKGAGSFVIDHPQDPINKLLYHYFVESPEVKNLYDGIAILNRSGEATIELPSYFLALNKDLRYLATPVGEPMPNLHLEREVRPKWLGWLGTPAFKISGGEPGGRISWQVTGVRKDPFILKYPIVPEVEKGEGQPSDVGEYICPECYAI